jgi:hypothetical protein
MASAGPVQSNTLYQSGSLAATPPDGNFTSVRATDTPAAAGAITQLAAYDVPPATTIRMAGGRKFMTEWQLAGGAQMTTGNLTLAVEHQDGSRTIFFKAAFVTLAALADQVDDLKKPAYTTTVYASGARGDKIVVLADDGGTAIDVSQAGNNIQLPYDYRIG